MKAMVCTKYGPSDVLELKAVVLLLATILIMSSASFAQGGSLVWDEITSPALEDNLIGDSVTRRFAVYLPPGYETSEMRYPVFYYVSGYGVDYQGVQTYARYALKPIIDPMVESGEIGEMIGVILDGYNKFWGSWYLNSPTIGDWETFIVRDLVDHVDTHYRTIPHRDSRGVDGHSMGGDAAPNLALRYPEVFGVLVAQAGDHDFDTEKWRRRGLSTAYVNPKSWDDLDKLDHSPRVVLSLAAAGAPNPDKPPFFLDWPAELVNGEARLIPEVWEKIVALDNMHSLERYLAQPVRLNGIMTIHGAADQVDPVAHGRAFDRVLTDLGIDHVYLEHGGGHIPVRPDLSLPFLSDHLRFVLPGTPAVVSATSTPGTAVAGRPTHLEAKVELDAPLETASTDQTMVLDLSDTGISSKVILDHTGDGRYTGSATLTPLESGQYRLPILLRQSGGDQYPLQRIALDVYPDGDRILYEDGPGEGWTLTVSGSPTSNLMSTSFVHRGSFSHALKPFPGSVRYAFDDPEGMDLFGYTHLEFYINGGEHSEQDPNIGLRKLSDYQVVPQPDTWTLVSIPISDLPLNDFGRLSAISVSGVVRETFYIDDMRIVAREMPTPVATEGVEAGPLASSHALSQNIPNPFNASTTIAYDLPEAGHVRLRVYTITGQKVAELVDGDRETGHHRVEFDGAGLATGVYLYRLEVGRFIDTRRMLLMK